jgi:hypothetical protein
VKERLMARELGSSQISALLESVPGIVNVLRSPVADAMVAMIRAGAGLEEFDRESANELVQYAVRRGLISSGEGDQLLEDVKASGAGKGRRRKAASRRAATRKPPPLVAKKNRWGKPAAHAKMVDAAKAKPKTAKPKAAKPAKAKLAKGKSKPKAKPKREKSKAKSGKSDKKPVKRSTRR